MAANNADISLVKVYTQFDGSNNEQLVKVEVLVTETDGSTAITGLVNANFELSSNTGGTWAATETGSGQYFLTPGNGNFTITHGDYYVYAQVDATNTDSDKLFVDFMQGYSDSETTYTFTLPNETGNYKINLDKANEEDFSTVMSDQLRANETITTADSKVLVRKSYLTHFIGENLSVDVTIGKGDSATLEVSMFADKQ